MAEYDECFLIYDMDSDVPFYGFDETFKELHKQAENLRTGGYNTGEIRKDISNMEDEKEQLIKRVDRLKRKVEQHPNANTMMNVAKNLRLERDKEKKLAEQRQEQLTLSPLMGYDTEQRHEQLTLSPLAEQRQEQLTLRQEQLTPSPLAEQRQEQLTLEQLTLRQEQLTLRQEQLTLRIKRLQQQLHDQRQAAVGATPEGTPPKQGCFSKRDLASRNKEK
ncbi:hypothetical protein DPMN_133475 [Dreissena polymorpha]|uniref:Uncharacterized protein n=1 Tax=Dreissena polymorpha TaxID=45954 RepID=A0A9D4FTM7_DREPO|nr:hypothetical protein DPMN_133475 [Dreissena polymorpha]